jgi:hypothetical protein
MKKISFSHDVVRVFILSAITESLRQPLCVSLKGKNCLENQRLEKFQELYEEFQET